jgi:hypothetical protein
MEALVYNRVPLQVPAESETSPESDMATWPADILVQIFDDKAKAFASKCAEDAIPAPDSIGYELLGADDAVIGEAEMAWETKKIAFLLDGQSGSKEAFENAGWRTILLDDEIQAEWFKEEE